MDGGFVLRVATGLLSVAFFSGLVLAGVRFASDRPSPPGLANLHGLAATAGLAVLVLGEWRLAMPAGAGFGTATLLLAFALGGALYAGYRRRRRALPQGLVFVHLSVAFVGYLAVCMAWLLLPA